MTGILASSLASILKRTRRRTKKSNLASDRTNRWVTGDPFDHGQVNQVYQHHQNNVAVVFSPHKERDSVSTSL